MSMRAFDDADQAVSIAAILFFIRAAFTGIPVMGAFFRGGFGDPTVSLFLLLAIAYGVAGYGLLKTIRWAWPLGVGVAAVSILLHLMTGQFFSLLFDAAILYLLFRPAVRERFGQLSQR